MKQLVEDLKKNYIAHMQDRTVPKVKVIAKNEKEGLLITWIPADKGSPILKATSTKVKAFNFEKQYEIYTYAPLLYDFVEYVFNNSEKGKEEETLNELVRQMKDIDDDVPYSFLDGSSNNNIRCYIVDIKKENGIPVDRF